MAADEQLICPSLELADGGRAVRFAIASSPHPLPAFVIRYQGRVHGYLNACRHLAVQLDMDNGELYDLTGHYLICSMHGARYRPDNGLCIAGPCQGTSLHPVPVHERDGMIYYTVTDSKNKGSLA